MSKRVIEELYEKYYKTALIYTVSLCKNKELAEDIVSDAFEKAILTIDKEKKHFKYWLLAVCKNAYLDYARKNKRIDPSQIEEHRLIDPSSVIESVLEKEKNRVLFKAIMQLPENYQEILILFYYANIPLYEIETIMNLTKANAKTLVSRARKKLKMVLEEMDYEF